MTDLIKEMCFFMLLAEMLICLVPFGTYEKYLRVLMGIMVIAKLSVSLFTLFSEKNMEKMIQGLEEREIEFWEEDLYETETDDYKE